MKTIIAIIAICLAALLLAGCAQGEKAAPQGGSQPTVTPGQLPPDITEDAGLSGAYAEIDEAENISG